MIPHAGNAGMGVQAVTLGKIPHASDAGRGDVSDWLHTLADRLARVRIVHGDWSRCLNHHYGADETAVFLDPPYLSFEALYSDGKAPVASAVADWAREHGHLRVALCGHRGDYELPGWDVHDWSRGRLTYGGGATTEAECVWFSPACLRRSVVQPSLFAAQSDGDLEW